MYPDLGFIYVICANFVLCSVRETEHVQLGQEQFEELLELISRIPPGGFERRYMITNPTYIDIIYKGELYSYLLEDVNEDTFFVYMGDDMSELVRRLLEYSPIRPNLECWKKPIGG
jgi:hypothetical protein